MYNDNDIIDIANNIVDEIGESINNEINNKFGHSIDWETLEEISNKVWEQLEKSM